MKPKRRYLLAYFEGERSLEELVRLIKARVSELYGALGLQSANIRLMELMPGFIAIRTNHQLIDEVLFALCTAKLEGSDILPLRVSGSLKKLKAVAQSLATTILMPPI